MDFLHRTPMMDDLKDRIRLFTSKRSLDEASGLEDISLYLNTRLEELRDNEEQKFVSVEYSILLGPIVLVSLWALIYTDKKLLAGIFMLIVLSYLLFANYRMKDLILQNQGLKWKDEFKENATLFIQSKILYLKSALTIKKTRIILLRNFFGGFLPLFLCTSYYFILGKHAFNNVYLSVFVGVLLGATFWVWFYSKEIEDLNQELQLATDMENALLVRKDNGPQLDKYEEE